MPIISKIFPNYPAFLNPLMLPTSCGARFSRKCMIKGTIIWDLDWACLYQVRNKSAACCLIYGEFDIMPFKENKKLNTAAKCSCDKPFISSYEYMSITMSEKIWQSACWIRSLNRMKLYFWTMKSVSTLLFTKIWIKVNIMSTSLISSCWVEEDSCTFWSMN